LSGNTLYGTAGSGGSSGNGTVFALKTDGMGFTTLHSFTAPSTNPPYANSDGASPSSLILSSNTLYGMASQGGTSGWGTVFAINTDGTGFTNLHSFTGGSDGGVLDASLILSGHTLYGTAYGGGSSGNGTVFKVNADGTGFTTLYSFAAGGNDFFGWYTNSDGAQPSSLILSGNTLYGTAVGGGSVGVGTAFSLSMPPPRLTIIPSRTNLILTWPTYAPGVTLQSTTNLVSPVWTTNSPAPVVVNGQNTVTNPICGTQQFFRLSQ
jgi:uncharacterized repeat protein (TIGR03803 family)